MIDKVMQKLCKDIIDIIFIAKEMKIIIYFIINKMNRSKYKSISQVGGNQLLANQNPLAYALQDKLDMMMSTGSQYANNGAHSEAGQEFMAEYCGAGWDDFCELGSRSKADSYPNNIVINSDVSYFMTDKKYTAGDVLVRNTAAKKYLKEMANCQIKLQPFDPLVASSPMISTWEAIDGSGIQGNCVPSYSVDPSVIDNDPVMNKLLTSPNNIGFDILINIYNTMKADGTLKGLKGTKLGQYYTIQPYFIKKGGLGV